MFYYYLIAVNILAFALMGIDKYKAQHHLWRIPEKTLFLSAIIGGSAGAIFGMNLFRHSFLLKNTSASIIIIINSLGS